MNAENADIKQLQQWLADSASQRDDTAQKTLTSIADLIIKHAVENDHAIFSSNIKAGLCLAKQCERFGADENMMAAGLLFPTKQYHGSKIDKELTSLNPTIIELTQGVKKMAVIDNLQNIENKDYLLSQSDSLRRMLLAIVGDVRVIFLKLIECVNTLHALKNKTKTEKTSFAEKVMQLYAPLANRLGLGQLKWELEDIAFRYLNQEEYFKISKALKLRRTERESFIQIMQTDLDRLMKDAHISQHDISGRVKHIYSIYKKITRKDIQFSDIYDTSALRILVPSIENCYEALSIIHHQWQHIAEEFDDYIAKPKANGYQSIHTAVTVPGQGCVEVQIRTYQMHDEAELGVAAHWKYKEGQHSKSSYANKIDLLRQMLDWQKSINDTEEADTYNKIFGDRIYVFSPQEKIFDLPQGATTLDYAYRVHTQVGHRCKGAKINGKLEPLTQTLKTGDTVEVLTGKEDQPSRDWLNLNLGYITTNHAITKVRLFFRKENYEEHLSNGQGIWEKGYRRHELDKNDIDNIYQRFNFKSTNDLLASLGAGDIGIATIIHHLHSLKAPATAEENETNEYHQTKKNILRRTQSQSQFSIDGVDNVLTQIALCCKPIPGDPIVGYITKGRGISIHKQDCANLRQSQLKAPERITQVAWQQSTQQHFLVEINIEANDRKGILNDITQELQHANVVILGMNSYANPIDNMAYINITIDTQSTDELQKLLSKISRIQDIFKVQRK